MTIEEIKELKDRVYELEGLLELAQLREDKLEELTPLIEARLNALTVESGEHRAEKNSEEEAEAEAEEVMVEEKIEDVTENYDTSVGGIFSQTEEPVKAPRCLNDQYAAIRKNANER